MWEEIRWKIREKTGWDLSVRQAVLLGVLLLLSLILIVSVALYAAEKSRNKAPDTFVPAEEGL